MKVICFFKYYTFFAFDFRVSDTTLRLSRTVFVNQFVCFFQFILNVTSDLPNTFEEQGSIKYMQIPISDHIGQNLASFFPQAIEFIGEFTTWYVL